jgi:hypothetical protein
MYRYVAILAVCIAIAACANLVSSREIGSAEAKWNSSGNQNYDFTLMVLTQIRETDCSEDPIVKVQVRSGKTVKFGTCSPESEMAQSFGSVPLIFETIRANRQERPPRYLVYFDNALGYPTEIDANYSRWMTDHAVQYYIRDFRRID